MSWMRSGDMSGRGAREASRAEPDADVVAGDEAVAGGNEMPRKKNPVSSIPERDPESGR